MTDAEFADMASIARSARHALKPPPRLTLSAWADANFYLSPETAAEPGRWRSLPYQVGILDAITDPAVEKVSIMKSARIGYTLCMSAAIGYFIEHEPSSMLVVQPTVDDAKSFSKETIAPMLRDVPVLAGVVFRDVEDKGPKDPTHTLQHKAFPGGVLSLVGANSGAGFRRISRRVVMFDEVDAYPPSAGSEGDQYKLGSMRAQAFWNRKIIAGSTPLTAGSSRIAELYESGDQRRYYVPCPHCGHMDFLTFSDRGGRGHWMAWDEGKPETAHFLCRGCGCVIEHKDKRRMVEGGEWRGDAPFRGHASFWIWAAYSYSPNATWAHIAAEFLEAKKGGPEKLKTFVNTVLGETWTERGDAPDWLRLYERREHYGIATVPRGVVLLTAGVDVQRDRLVYEVVGWGEDRQSWSVDAGVLPGDTARETGGPWDALDEILARTWPGEDGAGHSIRWLGIDSGFNTQNVYSWARRNPGRIIACKGVSTAKTLLGAPSSVDVTIRGKRYARGCKVWPVGVDIAKSELYGWLRLEAPTRESGEAYPSGYCHFPEYGEDFFKQLTAEHLIRSVKRNGFVAYEWAVQAGRENHWLDARVYARAAATLAGIDRVAAAKRAPRPAPPPPAPAVPDAASEVLTEQAPRPAPRGGWLGGPRGGTVGGGGWIRRR